MRDSQEVICCNHAERQEPLDGVWGIPATPSRGFSPLRQQTVLAVGTPSFASVDGSIETTHEVQMESVSRGAAAREPVL